jgi:hypothetical protein
MKSFQIKFDALIEFDSKANHLFKKQLFSIYVQIY